MSGCQGHGLAFIMLACALGQGHVTKVNPRDCSDPLYVQILPGTDVQGCRDTGTNLNDSTHKNQQAYPLMPEKFIYPVTVCHEMLAVHAYTCTKPLPDFSTAQVVIHRYCQGLEGQGDRERDLKSSSSKSQLCT